MLLVVPALLVFVLVSLELGFNRHLRYVLPCYPFAFIFASRVAVIAERLGWLRLVLNGLLVWQAVSVVAHGTSGISYFNEFAGGSKNGFRWLMGSNVDWGQDFMRLKDWQDKHPEAIPLQLLTQSTYDPADLGIRYEVPPPFHRGFPDTVDELGRRGPVPGWYAVSLNSYFFPGERPSLPWNNGLRSGIAGQRDYVRRFSVTERIGDSIILLHVTADDAARVMNELLAEEQIVLTSGSGGVTGQAP